MSDLPHPGATRDRMIGSALDLIAERGYEGMSLQMVADATGVTKAAVYYHFHAKSDLLDAILQRLFANAPPPPDPRTMRSRRARVGWAVEGILRALTHERRVISVISGDPVIRRHPTFVSLVQGTRHTALRLLFGDTPTDEDRATFALATCAVHTLPDLETLSDEELVAALRPAMYRLFGLTVPTKTA